MTYSLKFSIYSDIPTDLIYSYLHDFNHNLNFVSSSQWYDTKYNNLFVYDIDSKISINQIKILVFWLIVNSIKKYNDIQNIKPIQLPFVFSDLDFFLDCTKFY